MVPPRHSPKSTNGRPHDDALLDRARGNHITRSARGRQASGIAQDRVAGFRAEVCDRPRTTTTGNGASFKPAERSRGKMTQPTHKGSRRVIRNPTQQEDCGQTNVCDGHRRQPGRSGTFQWVLSGVDASGLLTHPSDFQFLLSAAQPGAPRGPPDVASDRHHPVFRPHSFTPRTR